jgi:hypothetical protein
MDLSKLKLNELMYVAKSIEYIKSEENVDTWSTEEIYHGAIYETVQSKYQVKASEIVCGMFSPLKLLFKRTIRNYILVMTQRKSQLVPNVNGAELSF